MPPRVTYWTGTWDSQKEAISKEVNALRTGSRARAPVVSFSPAQRIRIDRGQRVLMLSGPAWPALRAVAFFLEPRGDVTHVFGGQFSWHLFRALGRRPILLTAVASAEGARLPDANIEQVAVETAAGIAEWLEAGIPRERIHVIHPGIDLDWHRPPGGPSPDRFRLLFASTPSDPAEIAPRGIPTLVDLARLRPDVDIWIPWRQWGDLSAARRAIEALRPPPNFIVSYENATDMRPHYANAHATVVCFAPGVGKACPNFVVEGLAMGRPCLCTSDSRIAHLITNAGAGLVVPPDARSLAEAIDPLRLGWVGYAERARGLAEDAFDLRQFRARYEALYEQIANQAPIGCPEPRVETALEQFRVLCRRR